MARLICSSTYINYLKSNILETGDYSRIKINGKITDSQVVHFTFQRHGFKVFIASSSYRTKTEICMLYGCYLVRLSIWAAWLKVKASVWVIFYDCIYSILRFVSKLCYFLLYASDLKNNHFLISYAHCLQYYSLFRENVFNLFSYEDLFRHLVRVMEFRYYLDAFWIAFALLPASII
jgi:hypothetical protein